MGKTVFLLVFLSLNLGNVTSQSPDFTKIATAFLTNTDFRALLQSPKTAASLEELFDTYNTTRNATAVLNSIVSDPQVSAVAASAARIVVESLTKSALTEAKVGDACQNDVVMFLEGLSTGEEWALRMIDAMGKPGSNLYSRQTKFLGSYEECLNINAVSYSSDNNGGIRESGSFDGKYCSAVFYLPGIPQELFFLGIGYLQLGLCVPNTCSNSDVTALIAIAEGALLNNTVPYYPMTYCQDGRKDIGSDVIAAICILGILGCLVLFGTLYDIVAVQMKSTHDNERKSAYVKNEPVVLTHTVMNVNDAKDEKNIFTLNGPEMNGKPENSNHVENGNSLGAVKPVQTTLAGPTERSALEKALLAFSVYTNGVKLLGTQQAGSLGAVNGIRFLSMAWVILGHSYYFAIRYDANFMQHFQEKVNQWTFMGIAYADVSVDSFFTLSGLLVAYLSLNQLRKVDGPRKMNWFMYYFHRFWRLTPAYMLVMMVGTVILPYLLSGPMWNYDDVPFQDLCRKSWWTNLLYVNNYVETDKPCMGWSWYLANDMQYYWISPLLLLPLFYHIGAGLVSCLLFLVASTVAVGMITHEHRYPVQQYLLGAGEPPKDGDYIKNLYYPSYARMGPYIIGVFTGYLLYRWKCRCNIPKIVNLVGWFVSICIATVIVYYRYSYEGDHILSRLDSDVFMALHRTAWAVALCWIIFSCATGHGGWINEVLSWKPFIPLGRLSYCAYLIHPLVMLAFYTSRMNPTYFTDFEVIYLFLGNITLTYGLSFVVSLLFESPMMGLEKAIFNPGKH